MRRRKTIKERDRETEGKKGNQKKKEKKGEGGER